MGVVWGPKIGIGLKYDQKDGQYVFGFDKNECLHWINNKKVWSSGKFY